ncbi:MFS transporter [Nocardioides sp. LMS-CY]|uniref:MFS transporter n=1 Tax=Nocardioides sp. (strain LMS-CY) TaxID=2840457 RepID=UPI001C003E14|nr:MFS transporter [Nocardioides sp. LMS-CY]QWF22368.1 MFS transporter [Nocardioides sp. LMS-CY]
MSHPKRRWPRNFYALWAATATTNLTDGVVKIGLPLLAVSMTSSPGAIAAVTALGSLPWLLFALLAGAVADRVDRRRLMIALNLVRVFVAFVMVLLLATGVLILPLVYVGAFALGTCEAFIDTTRMSVVQMVVPRHLLERGYGRLTATETVANEFVGPPLGGALAGLSLALTMATGSVGYLIAAVALLLMPGAFRLTHCSTTENPPARGLTRQIGAGLQYVWSERTLAVLLSAAGISSACWAGWLAIMPAYAVRGPLQLSETGYGLLIGLLGVGGFIGALSTDRLRKILGRRNLLIVALAATTAMLLAPALSETPAVIVLGTALGGLGAGTWNVAYSTLRALVVPDEMMGRYSGVSRLVSFGAMPLGAAAAGGISELATPRWAFIAATIGMLSALVIVPTRITASRIAEIEQTAAIRRDHHTVAELRPGPNAAPESRPPDDALHAVTGRRTAGGPPSGNAG